MALERARARLADATLVELEPDAPLPFGDCGFELVLTAETAEHVRDLQLFLSEIRRVLGRAAARPDDSREPAAGAARRPLSPHLRRFTSGSCGELEELGFDVGLAARRSGLAAGAATR